MNNTILLAFIIFFALIIGVSAFVLSDNLAKPTQDHNVQVVASFYPLYFFAQEIGGEKVSVTNITPAGAEPHDYEPTVKDITEIERADLVIINGGNLEPWSDKIKSSLNSNIQMIAIGEALMTRDSQDEELQKDPHVWLDPTLAKAESEKIAEALIVVDPENADHYRENEIILSNKLDELDQKFSQGLANCSSRTIVTSHAAFGYLADRYGLQQLAIAGLSPDEEPSAKQLADVADFAKQYNVKYIFFETLVSPKLAETIAQEVGAQTISFNPLEGLTTEEEQQGENYFTIQEQNLANLQTALGCQ